MHPRLILLPLLLLAAPAATAAEPATRPTTDEAAAIVIRVDTTDAPEMEAYGQTVQALAEQWYPKIIEMLPSDGFEAPREVFIRFDPDYDGVAAAAGNRIRCSVKWFSERPEDLGAIVHELAHVVQQYPRGRHPGWLVEGIADHVRFFNYEPEEARPQVSARRARYDASYRTSAAFLDWAARAYDEDLVIKLNAACRERRYRPGIWEELTGRSVEALGDAWRESL